MSTSAKSPFWKVFSDHISLHYTTANEWMISIWPVDS